ncbi:alpha/beta fold hydrolase [Herbidospora sp. NEAU-GS84]|uniref:Alpha/beta fold hydrolase n=1 Tax=Herbidospora solisilvae TaxID=2696284 RepID=A0A7C9JC76_9ACTN|nr:alpha/beta hydrolase [Herbidospora solisilvae]NAS23304.1 alpha/beta fold hydrolase [Herbidospora solisilvae]
MPTFATFDGTVLSYRVTGQGDPLVVLPGGPMQDAAYLGDLGGLPAHRRLVILDPRGTGGSATPADPATYRCDRQVADVEALRLHLGLDRIDVLGHSAGANLAVLYAAAHPGAVGRLVLVTPSLFAVGLDVTGEERLAVARLRAGEPWYPEAIEALELLVGGAEADFRAVTPFFHGRYDAAAKAAVEGPARNAEAARIFGSDGAYDPAGTRAALGELAARVLLVGGEYDVNSVPAKVEAFAALFPAAECVVQPGAGHYPWLDDPRTFVATVSSWLAQPDSASK